MRILPENRPALRLPPDHQRIAVALQGLELLAPDSAARDLPTAALDYLERCTDDILQLEMAHSELIVALSLAWQQDAYGTVVQLVTGLARIVNRLSDRAVAEQIMRLGIDAAGRLCDSARQALWLNRLGSLLVSHGKYDQGWQLWHDGIRFAQSSQVGDGLWHPLAQFVLIADILGNPDAVARFYTSISAENAEGHLVARFIRGFYAHSHDAPDRAYEDYTACLRLIAQQASNLPHSPSRQLFAFTVQVELARLLGDYARAQALAETVHGLAQLYSDRYTAAEMLIDQAWYIYQQGQFADLRLTYERLRLLAVQANVPHISQSSRFIEQRLAISAPSHSRDALADQMLKPATHVTEQHADLSARENEVMRLVAAGLANQEIARRLVVTTATVKKHLEHIFIKLNVHSRTAAIATMQRPRANNSSFGE